MPAILCRDDVINGSACLRRFQKHYNMIYDTYSNNNNKNNNNKTKKHSAVPSVFYKTNKTRTKQKRGAIKIPYFIKYQEYNNNKKSERKSPGRSEEVV